MEQSEPRSGRSDMEIGHVPWPHDRQEDKEVRKASFFRRVHGHTLNPSISALSLRLFGKDITTVGQQKAKTQDENREHQTETPVEHAPMLEEDKEPTPVLDDDDYTILDHKPGEVGE